MSPSDAAPLVGRARELDAIGAALDAIDRGRAGHCLAVAGALGLGKSRLLRELDDRAEARGHLVLGGQGSELEMGIPYGVAVDALDGYLCALPAPELARVTAGLAGELSGVLPTVAPLAPPAGATDAERYRIHRALGTLIGRLAGRRPLVLRLDDVHWADAETAELLAHLIRHPPAGTLLAVAYRPARLAPELQATLARAHRDGRCRLLELAPLSAAQAIELLPPGLDAERRTALVREGGGNPFFLEQLARAAPDGAAPPRHAATESRGGRPSPAGDVPQAVFAAIEQELAVLAPAERRLLAGAAVAGEPFEIDLAAAAAGVDEAAALTALDALVASDHVRPTDSPRRFTFRHPLVRRAVYQAAGAGWRIGAHRSVADALRARGAPLSRVAEHVERCAAPGDEGAIATLLDAGHAAATRAPATAAQLFGRALELLPAGHDRRLELLVSLSTSLGAAGRLDDARGSLREVVGELPADAHELRARAVTFIARIDHARGRQGEARALLERTLAELPEPRSRAGAALQLELVMDHLFTAEFGPMRDAGEAALALARELGDPLLEAAALAGLAHAAQNLRDVPASLAAARSAGAILDGLDDARCAGLLETFWWLAAAEDVLERWDACLRHAERGIRLARAYGVSFVFVALTHTLAVALGWQGRLAQARAAAEETVDAAHLSGNDASITYAYTTQCFVHNQAGEAHEAVRAGELAAELGRSLPRGLFVSLPHANLGAALLAAGQPERARAQLLEARARGALVHWVGRCWWEIWMSAAERGLGRLDEAERWAAEARRTADAMGLVGRTGAARVALAAVRLAQGDADAAARRAREAVELLDAGGRPSDAARARIHAARALAALGRDGEAVAELERARATLRDLGAPRLADEAARELRRLGVRVARPGAAVPGGPPLSDRERQIAELVSAGRTNREIAAQLHLSEKTVANHLTRVFTKLSISSRAALAAAVIREGV